MRDGVGLTIVCRKSRRNRTIQSSLDAARLSVSAFNIGL
jgi:hypothetical protein